MSFEGSVAAYPGPYEAIYIGRPIGGLTHVQPEPAVIIEGACPPVARAPGVASGPPLY